MLSPTDKQALREWNRRQTDTLFIRFFPTDDRRSKDLEAFLKALQEAAPRIGVHQGDKAADGPPEIRVGQGIGYHLLPRDRELAPFLEALELAHAPEAAADRLADELSSADQERLAGLRLPAVVTLFVAPGCPFCPDTVRRIIPLHLCNPLVRVRIYDAALFPEFAAPFAIKAVPTAVLDQDIRFSGTFPLAELVRALVDQDPARLGVSALETMLSEGQAPRLGRLMLEHGQVFPALVDLLVHPKWPVRLGTLVALEEVIAEAPRLLDPLWEALWQRFDPAEEAVKGDILYLMGEAGAREEASRIQAVHDRTDHAEVREAAREALQKLE